MSDFLSREIPAQLVPATLVNPRVLVFYTDLKVGKTSIAAWLSCNRNAVWLDLERGCGGLPGRPVDVLSRSEILNPNEFKRVSSIRKVDYYLMMCSELAARKPRFDYLIVDKVDQLEVWADEWATAAYKNTIIGKDSFKEDTIKALPFIGWSYWHDKFLALWNAAKSAAPYVIFTGSLKQGGSEKYGKHDDAKAGLACSFDLDLDKRQRKTAVGDSDATGLVWREPDGSNWLSFASREKGAFTGCRIPRLEGARFRFSWISKYVCCGQEIGPKDYPQHLQSAHQGVKPADLRVEIEVAWNNLYVEENGVPK